MNSSAAYMTQFQAAVLAHLKQHVSEEEWVRFRKLAAEGLQEEPIEGSELWTREELVNEAPTIGGESLQELLDAYDTDDTQVIGKIEESPLFYVESAGIYAWALTLDDDVLSVWLTAPSYPPGW